MYKYYSSKMVQGNTIFVLFFQCLDFYNGIVKGGAEGMDRFREYDNALTATRVTMLRKQLGLTQEDFAEAIGVSTVTVKRIESGERGPSKDVLIRISQCLDISLDALMDPDSEREVRAGIAADYDASVVGEDPAAYYSRPLPEGVRRGGAYGTDGIKEKEKLKALIGAAIDEMPVELARQAAELINTLRRMSRTAEEEKE